MSNHTNLFKTKLVGSYTNSDTVITVEDASELTTFPTKLVIFNAGVGDPSDAFGAGEAEIVNATGKTTNDITIERGQENTSAVALSDGWDVYQSITAETIDGKEPTFTKNTAFNKDFGNQTDTVTEGNDTRLSDAREWIADTVTQVEAEAGTDTSRKAWTVERVWQAINSWWSDVSIAISKVTGLQSELDSKANLSGGNELTGLQILKDTGFQNQFLIDRTDNGNVTHKYGITSAHSPTQRAIIYAINPDDSWTSLLELLSNGNVGIGTENPSAKLDVDGDIKFGSGTNLQTALDEKAGIPETGSWTPTYVPQSGSFDTLSYSTQSGSFWKIGDLYIASFAIRTSNVVVGSASGRLEIGGLPAVANVQLSSSISIQSRWNVSSPVLPISATAAGLLLVNEPNSTASARLLQVSEMVTGSNANFNRLDGALIFRS